MFVKRLDGVTSPAFIAGVSFSFMRIAVPSWRRSAAEVKSLPQREPHVGLSREELVSLFDGDLTHARLRMDRERRKGGPVLTKTVRDSTLDECQSLEAMPG